MNVVALAGSLPRDPQFREWIARTMSVIPFDENEPVSIDEAAEIIRCICGVDSRRQLAEDREAEARFHTLLRKPFIDWRDEQF